MNTEDLTQEINDVFPFVEKPKGIDIAFHKDECVHCKYLRDDLAEYINGEIPPKAIRNIHQEMSCLSAAGWHWVFPSYLRFCLTAEAAYNTFETEFLIYNLSPKEKYESETLERLSKFNKQQIQCIIHFLEWCLAHEHWSTYCPEEINYAIEFISKNCLSKA